MKRFREFGFWTMAFLVLLRLAIGWHFLFEGLHKVDSISRGETTTSKPFTSAGYFREAPGPLAWEMREILGDPDDEALARLTLQPPSAGEDPQSAKPYLRMPPALKKEWEEYLERFAKHYNLDASQRSLADARLKQAESGLAEWLEMSWDPSQPRQAPTDEAELARKEKMGLKSLEKAAPSGNATVKILETPAERVEEYRQKVKEYRDMLDVTDATLSADVVGPKRLATKADAAAMRASLLADLDKKTAEFKASLETVLPPDPAALPAMGASMFGMDASPAGQGPLLAAAVAGYPGRTDPRLSPMTDEKTTPVVWWLDRTTAWGLTIIGACLLIGLLTRFNCVLAAGFLLMLYFSTPTWPWLPAPPNTMGNTPYVNANLIEMLALLTLATTASGRWFGVDALLHSIWTALFGQKKPRPAPVRVAA